MNVRSAPRSNYSNLVFTQGFIQDFYRDTKSECGRVRSAVPEIKRFVLVFAPQEIRGAHYAFGVGFHKGYFWLYVLRLVESAGTWLAVEAKLAKDAEETDPPIANTSSTWSVNRTQLTQFVEQMYYGDTP